MNAEEYEKRPYHLVRLLWTARLLGAVPAGLLFYIGFTEFMEEIRNNSVSPIVTMISGQYFLFITLTSYFTGLVLAYWKEGIGGAISLSAIVVLFIGWADFHVAVILAVCLTSMPSILYIVYWWMVYRYHHRETDES